MTVYHDLLDGTRRFSVQPPKELPDTKLLLLLLFMIVGA